MASSSSRPSWKYDVFINFRGRDTRRHFVSHLYRALLQKGIKTFIDAEDLEKGVPLSELLTAIQESRISIVVFSQEYAFSSWCLKELVEILKCKKTKNQIVLPIFYEVEPSHVCQLKEKFEEAFTKYAHSNVDVEELERWRSALAEAGKLSGWHSENFKHDAELLDEIVEKVCNNIPYPSTSREVEMDSHIHEMQLLLHPPGVEKNDVRIVGIWGMGGLGKTTIARAVYNKIYSQFEACCFLENVNEEFMGKRKLQMQKQLLSCISGDHVRTSNIRDKGYQVMLKKLVQRKVFLVIDDVHYLYQIEDLLGEQHSFGGGSRIIITTRVKHLLGQANGIYRPKFLSASGAMELFRRYAFSTNQPTRDYDDLSSRVIKYAQGLPLALKVLGAFLCNKTVCEWENELDKLREIPQSDIHDVLKTSYDGLNDTEKSIFLDFACFFKVMKRDCAIKIRGSCGFYPDTGISGLIDRALITESGEGELEMHGLQELMGREIVRQESIKQPGKRSRLWSYEDGHEVLTENTATEAIESIILDLSNSDEVRLNAEAFGRMTQLRLLMISNEFSLENDYNKQHLIGQLEFLSRKLRFLTWHGFPHNFLPFNCQFKNLVHLDMRYSLIDRLWEETQRLEKLKTIDLSYCGNLMETPDFTRVPNLETLILQSCISLVKVHPSIWTLTKLCSLDLNGCKNLKDLASSIRMQSLKILVLSGCSSLDMFPEISEVMWQMTELNLSGLKIKELPSSINNLTRLSCLGLQDCKELKSLPNNICQLKFLRKISLSGCTNFEEFPSIEENMEGLRELHLDGTSIKELSPWIERLQGLEELNLRNCESLVHLPDALNNGRTVILRI